MKQRNSRPYQQLLEQLVLCKVYQLFINWIRLVDRCERLKEQQRRYFPSVNPL